MSLTQKLNPPIINNESKQMSTLTNIDVSLVRMWRWRQMRAPTATMHWPKRCAIRKSYEQNKIQ